MDTMGQNPFAVLTMVVAPAVLTNASSVLAMSTINRFLRASERMRALSAQLDRDCDDEMRALLLVQVGRVERQAVLLLRALRAIYVALGCFAGASLVIILGATLVQTPLHFAVETTVGLGLGAGFAGAGSLVWGCTNLFSATRLSLLNITEEAGHVRRREIRRSQGAAGEKT